MECLQVLSGPELTEQSSLSLCKTLFNPTPGFYRDQQGGACVAMVISDVCLKIRNNRNVFFKMMPLKSMDLREGQNYCIIEKKKLGQN